MLRCVKIHGTMFRENLHETIGSIFATFREFLRNVRCLLS